MYILGISCSNDGTAALIKDGDVIAAAAEERFSRVKMHLGFPRRAIQECLRIGGIDAREIDVVAMSFKDYLRANPFYTNALMSSNGCPDIENEMSLMMLLKEGARQVANGDPVTFSLRKFSEKNANATKKIYEKAFRDLGLDGAHLVTVDHHLSHAASAYYTSGLKNCLIVTADGYGDNYSTTVCTGQGGEIKRLHGTPYTDSPGVFYTAVTKFLGFRSHRHEGKITGLAAYGDPGVHYRIMEECLFVEGRRFYAPCLTTKSLYELRMAWRLLKGSFFRHPQMNYTIDYFRKRLGSARREDVAAAAQKRLEDCFAKYVGEAIEETGLKDVALAGGVFGNVKLNQKIAEIPEVNSVFIHPDMGDGGTALGAAFVIWAEESLKRGKPFLGKRLSNVYLGPEFSDKDIELVLGSHGLSFKYYAEVEPIIARLIADKKIIGRFNGRCEYGPRALGNRSIIAEPTDRSINDWLNKRLHRTEFMPFAPSVLDTAAPAYYKGYDKGAHASEFMTITFDVEREAVKKAPAVCHVDDTARPQVVKRSQNPSYYRIIEEFEKLTGLPIVVNTSFNMHEEPIVCTPDDAVRAFLEGSVDYLAIGNFIVEGRK